MDGQDDPLAGEAGEPGEHGRSFCVDVDHVIGAERRRETAEEAGRHRRKALAVDGGHPLVPYHSDPHSCINSFLFHV